MTSLPSQARRLALALCAAALLSSSAASAHWCHDLWGSSYNIVVRPSADSVNVPASGSTTLDLWVQNNMGYALKGFSLSATASGYTIAVSRQAPKVTNFLLPGEKLRHTLTISRAGGAVLPVSSLSFYVGFGNSGAGQDQWYGDAPATSPVMMRKVDGSLLPPPIAPGLGSGTGNQADHLTTAAVADFGNLNTALDTLMTEFCSARGSWDSNGGPPITSNCTGSATTCPTPATRGTTKYDWQHLWAAHELAYRKGSLGARLPVLRARLRCSWGDGNFAFNAFPLALIGYLGEDAAMRTFLTGLISTGTADQQALAKAALLLFRNAADRTSYLADVQANLTSANPYVQMVSAATLGIMNNDDAAVNTVLIPRAAVWGTAALEDSPAQAQATTAAHLLELVSWDRRGWAVNAGDTGTVSFYGEGGAPDTVDPKAPTNVQCVAQPGGTVRVSWTQVTQGVNNLPESGVSYRVYRGNTARPGTAQKPGDSSGFDYNNVNPTSGIYFDHPALSGTLTYYFAVAAVDLATNQSVYSAEVSCVPRYAPVAVLTCTPMTGVAPLAVSCNAGASTDANGAADITGYSFRLGSQPATTVNPVAYNLAAGSHVVQLTVTDSTGLTGTTSRTVVASSSSGNQPPVAAAGATPTTGPMPLQVAFSSAGSSDPDSGQNLSFSWDFTDGSAAATTANPSHTFAAAGTYDVVLTVTDDGTPALSSTALVTVRVTGNRPPDVSTASASPRSGQAPLLVSFDATGVSDPDGHTVTVSWNFGDGSATSSARQVDHTYSSTGTFTATLSAQDNGLPAIGPATASFTITVGAVPASNRPPDCTAATVTPSAGIAPLTVTLDASGCTDPDGDGLSYEWHIPTGGLTEKVLTTATLDEVLAEPGSVEINLVVKDDAAQPMEATRKFLVPVTAGSGSDVVGGCGCGSAAAAPLLLAAGALVLALLSRRRRRS
ncbi:MAG: PKD domain-containing protein [Myxococcaceae bacterium]